MMVGVPVGLVVNNRLRDNPAAIPAEPVSTTETNADEGTSVSALHVGKYYPPFAAGIEHFMADLLPVLARNGMAVAALVHNHVAGLRGRVQSLPVPDGGEVTDGGGATPTVRLYRAPCLGQLLYAPLSAQFPFWLRRAIKTERPRILHLHTPNTSAFWALFLPSARRIPWVVHWHADVVSSEFDWRLKVAYPLYRPFEQRLLKKARAVIVTSPTYLEGSRALAPWRDKCQVIPLGIDPARIPEVTGSARRSAEGRWGGSDFRILSVGRLTYYKGYEYLIRALKDLPEARLVIVGEGQRRRALEALIDELALNDRACLAGHLPAEEMHALMATCDCFCLPSIERTEAFGMVLVEAMAHAKPAVVCDIPFSGVGWVVQDEVTGLVVPPADPGALAEAFQTLSGDRDRLARMGEQALKRYRREFRIAGVAETIAGLYANILR